MKLVKKVPQTFPLFRVLIEQSDRLSAVLQNGICAFLLLKVSLRNLAVHLIYMSNDENANLGHKMYIAVGYVASFYVRCFDEELICCSVGWDLQRITCTLFD